MALRVLRDREKPIARALTSASAAVGASNRPLRVAAFYLDSADDVQRAYATVKRELGVVEVVVLPAPLHVDFERTEKILTVLKVAGLTETQARKTLADLVRNLT